MGPSRRFRVRGKEGFVIDVPIPEIDAERVAALGTYNIMDSAPEPGYDDITELAAQICQCPVAIINLIDESRTWKKSTCGVSPDRLATPRDMAICSSVICRTDLLVVPDLKTDERCSENPNVAGEPHFRFYCGMPLINPEGYALGSLYVLDFEARASLSARLPRRDDCRPCSLCEPGRGKFQTGRGVTEIGWRRDEPYPWGGFIVTGASRTSESVVRLYNYCGNRRAADQGTQERDCCDR